MAEKLGVETIKADLLVVIGIVKSTGTAIKDGFKFGDILGLLTQMAAIPDLLKNKQALIDEFKDLDETERADVIAFIESNVTFENKRTEAIVDSVLELLAAALKLISAFKVEDVPQIQA